MPSPLATHLADRFAADARALRARGAALAGAQRRAAGGPNAAGYARMADACDRVQAIFAAAADSTHDDDALRALMPQLAGLVAGARSPDERNVYAGAVDRLTEGLAGGDDDDHLDDDDEDYV